MDLLISAIITTEIDPVIRPIKGTSFAPLA